MVGMGGGGGVGGAGGGGSLPYCRLARLEWAQAAHKSRRGLQFIAPFWGW